MNWIAIHAARLVVYSLLFIAFAAFFELDGYRRGEKKLFDYQGKQAAARIAVIEKTRIIEDETTTLLLDDLDNLRRLYDRERMRNRTAGGQPLSIAAANLQTCPNDAGERLPVRDAAGMLDEVESAISAIIAAGDAEIIKYRRLWERDTKLSQ